MCLTFWIKNVELSIFVVKERKGYQSLLVYSARWDSLNWMDIVSEIDFNF